MKSIFNPKSGKSNKMIIGLIAIILVVGILIAVILGNSGDKEPNITPSESTTEAITVDELVIPNETEENETENETETTDPSVLVLEEPTKQTVNNSTKPNTTKPSTVTPVKPSQPSGTVQGPNTSDIIDNGNDNVKEYSCNGKGHHCDSKETHDFVVGLEKKGCPYCGSHSCKSFYTYDEWGNACYDPTKCEGYSVKNDPNEYCQECGKKIGDGGNNTCVRFTVDTKCPVCKEQVKGKTCHSH